VIVPDYHFEIVRTDEALRALAPDWRRLYEEASRRNPFLSYAWNEACRAHLCPRAELFVVTVRSGAKLVGLAPLKRERQCGFRVLRFIGDTRSDYQGFLTSPNHAGMDSVIAEALASQHRHWDLAVLRQLADGWTRVHCIPPSYAFGARTIEADAAPYLSMPADWKELLASGPASIRRGQRAARKFEREGGSIVCLRGAHAVEGIEEAAEVEQASWKATRGTRRFASGGPLELLEKALTALGPRGEAEMWVARVDGKPAAFLLNFLTPDQVWYYQGAYDEAYRKLYPGMVLHYRCIERAFQEGRRVYDFLSGAEAYKLNWTTHSRPLHYQALFPNTLKGQAAYLMLLAPRWTLRHSRHARAARRAWTGLRENPLGTLAALKGRLHLPALGLRRGPA